MKLFVLSSEVILFSLVWTLISADQNCEPGKFGWKCKFTCYCKNSTECDSKNGTCLNGCISQRYGPGCQLLSVFKYSLEGRDYQGSIGTTEDDRKCLPWSSPIFIGFFNLKDKDFPDGKVPGAVCRNPSKEILDTPSDKGPWCFTSRGFEKGLCAILLSPGCPAGRFGELCKNECHCKNVNESCSKLGSCKSGCHPGWLGKSCQDKCSSGYFGADCKNKCGECKKNRCDFETGDCIEGCKKGWKGKFCNISCELGTYGENCSGTCGFCEEDGCDKVNGHCKDWCQDGYRGNRCKKKCAAGTFGKDCLSFCGHCKTGDCHHVSGLCQDGCERGWTGTRCLKPCEDYSYGNNCSFMCGFCKGDVTCAKDDGVCPEGCKDGYLGDLCKTRMVALEEPSSAVGGVIGGIVVVIVIIVVVVGFFLYRRMRKTRKAEVQEHNLEEEKKNVDFLNHTKETDGLLANESSLSEHLDDTDTNLNEPIYANVNTKKQSSPIKLANLYDYIRDNKKNECEGFKTEFNELPHGLMALCESAKKAENKPKNRYGNITAYDHSRVILDPLPNDPNSDYINANYIEGYNRKGAYIASQGPTKVMIRDFWRMIWQKRVCKIVMLTNLMEACKKKCEQYWSEEGAAKYGDITVEMLDSAVFNDFTIRTFKIASSGSSRIVKQFHFTSWSDHGALIYPTPLLMFKRKVKLYSPDSTAPVVVHCSAGIGRSGTYIAIDYLMEQAKNEGIVDVLKCAQLMRANRINMIQTWEQYVFVYEALLEAVLAGETTIPHSAFRARYEELCSLSANEKTTGIEEQFQILQKLTVGIESSQFKDALDPENLSKNRVKNVLPANRCRPNLYTQVEGCNNYINAVFLPGYVHRDSFIVTQMPLPNTVADFWRMLYDYNSHTVIMLNEFDRNDKSCALYWPEEYGYTMEYEPLSIELLSSTEDSNVSIRIFKLSNHIKKEERAIKQFQLKSWADYQKVPNNADALMQLMEMVYDWLKQNGKGPITVHCMNGASKSGVFCGINLLFERMQRDHEVDVFQTLKTIRVNRPQFIEDIEQYQFCYQMALKYLDYNDL